MEDIIVALPPCVLLWDSATEMLPKVCEVIFEASSNSMKSVDQLLHPYAVFQSSLVALGSFQGTVGRTITNSVLQDETTLAALEQVAARVFKILGTLVSSRILTVFRFWYET